MVDANVFVKLVLQEDDSNQAIAFHEWITESNVDVLAPRLFEYEFLSACTARGLAGTTAHESLQELKSGTVALVDPTPVHWRRAFQIRSTGNLKSGYPHLYDSIYHALAIEEDLTFLTADHRHVVKTEGLGAVILLSEFVSP